MKSLTLSVFFLLCTLSTINSADFSIKNSEDPEGNILSGLINILPTPKILFGLSKNLIVGYPAEFVYSAINKMCSSLLSAQVITPKILPDINEMQFQFRTACNRYSYPLLQANDIWKNPEFDRSKKVVILATGWTTNVNESDTIDEFAKAFSCRGDVNFLALDAASFIDTLYTWSAFNTEDIGLYIAKGLKQLIKIVPVENIHLIGHSLGAHIVGAAGRHFELLTNTTLPRITGLDPANPCFNEGETLTGLMRGDADFVDVIHTNPGVLGIREPLGDIDFYPDGLDPLTPGCFDTSCAHARAWEYYAETIYPGNKENFIGTRCNSLENLRKDKCSSSKTVRMGHDMPTDFKGSYFMEVRSFSPYGMNGNKHRTLSYKDCGVCEPQSEEGNEINKD